MLTMSLRENNSALLDPLHPVLRGGRLREVLLQAMTVIPKVFASAATR